MKKSSALVVLTAIWAQAVTVNLDGAQLGRSYEGIGAVSAGASTRLLFDYPDSIRSDILDYLFKPKFGAGFQHLKVEMGGGENSTCGSEPSHAITRAELANPVATRGYEFWLAKEGRTRNPALILDALAWSYPYWFSTTWSQDHADYIVGFLDAAKKGWGLDLNWFGACKNEKGYNRDWIVNTLRPTLTAKGYPTLKLHAAENVASDWGIADVLVKDAAFSSALDAISVHYPSRADNRTSPASARTWGKPLWANEEWSESGETWSKSLLLARNINKLYPRDLITQQSIWCPIDAIYGPKSGTSTTALPIWYGSTGAMRADTPWSGHYEVWNSIWAIAHTTQFAEPGWNYLTSGCGRPSTADWDGSYVTLKHPTSGDYSIIIVTSAATHYDFKLTGGLATSPVHVWSTDAQNAFIRGEDLVPTANSFSIDCAANTIYSLTTTTGQSKGVHAIPPDAKFPFPYYENYEGYQPGETPRYHSDQKGTFEVVDNSGNKALRQILPAEGILWGSNHTMDKTVTLFGDVGWTDYDLRAKVLIQAGTVEISARMEEVVAKRGYRLVLAKTGAWELRVDSTSLRSGTLTGFNDLSWHALKLSVSGSTVTASVDGNTLATVTNTLHSSGMAAFGSSYNPNMFDDLIVEQVGANGTIPTGILPGRARGDVRRKSPLRPLGGTDASRNLRIDGRLFKGMELRP